MKLSSCCLIVSSSLLALAVAACDKPAEPTPSESTARASTPPAAAPAATPPSGGAAAAPAPSGPLASTLHPDLLDPSKLTAQAPAQFQAKFTTTKGDFVVEVHRDWAPNGADRFYNLVKSGFFDDVRFFRAVAGFMVQWGISGDPAVSAKWQSANITDDPVKQSNKRGFVTFAKTGMPNSRSTQLFISYGDNSRLDSGGFAPFGQVTKGMEVIDALYTGYGEGAPGGQGPNQGTIQSRGNAYLDTSFPKLDGIKHAEIVAK
jgi:peptidyl-prolyl cis-trans isomerase A (cyclophilin A)